MIFLFVALGFLLASASFMGARSGVQGILTEEMLSAILSPELHAADLYQAAQRQAEQHQAHAVSGSPSSNPKEKE